MSDETDFWMAWRVRWLPRLALWAALLITLALGDCIRSDWAIDRRRDAESAWGRRGKPADAPPPFRLGPGGESARLVAGECHYDLKRAGTKADSAAIYKGQRDMDKGTMSCVEWMINNGEPTP
ncbi:MAG: hypothetical protein V4529_16745 [Gemmatimonadota bacterium]